MKSLEGQVAVVAGGGSVLGRAVALALAARGVRIVVTGLDEKALGVTVGEIVHAGGKARHITGDVQAGAHAAAVVARAHETFGRLDIAVASDVVDVMCMLSAARSFPGFHARSDVPMRGLVAVVDATSASAEQIVALARTLDGEKTTCNVLAVADEVAAEDACEDVGALAVFLCSRAGSRITGQTIRVAECFSRTGQSSPVPMGATPKSA